jgi:inorganic pyrophosphatase
MKYPTVDAVIETPQGSRNKYKYDEETGLYKLSRVLPSGSVYPFSFGFVPDTLSEDGDPLDVLVVADEPVPVGCVVASRLIGVLEAEQDKGEGPKRNDRLIAVAAQSRDHEDLTSWRQVNANLRKEIEHFFVSTHEQVGEKFKILGWQGPPTARRALDHAREAFRRKHQSRKKRHA